MQTFTSLAEEWRAVPGFPDYEVSNMGNVRSFIRGAEGHILSPSCNRQRYGYLHVNLSRSGKQYTRRIHRLVAEAFIPNPYKKPEVNHIDCNPANNNVENLEWVTPKENSEWKVKCGRSVRNHEHMVIATNVASGRKLVFASLKEAERSGFHRTAIRRCIRGEFTNHKGYVWEYANYGENN